MLAHVPSFGRNPRGSPYFLAYPVPKACMHVLGTTRIAKNSWKNIDKFIGSALDMSVLSQLRKR